MSEPTTFVVPPQNKVFPVKGEAKTVTVPAQDKVFRVPART